MSVTMLAQVMVLVCGLATGEPARTAAHDGCPACAESRPTTSCRDAAVQQARSAAREGDWNEAAEWWRDALLIDDRSGGDWLALGDVLVHGERYREAAAAYQRAIQADARLAERGTRGVAVAYARMGNDRQAIRWLEQAIGLGVRSEELWRDESLRRYRDDLRMRASTRRQVDRRGAAESRAASA